MIIYEVDYYYYRSEVSSNYRAYNRSHYTCDYNSLPEQSDLFEITAHDVSNVPKKRFKELAKLHEYSQDSLLRSLVEESKVVDREKEYTSFVDSISKHFK